jgi:hypothetical protein
MTDAELVSIASFHPPTSGIGWSRYSRLRVHYYTYNICTPREWIRELCLKTQLATPLVYVTS